MKRLAAVISALAVAGFAYFYCTGFCFSHLSYPTDADYVKRAVYFNADSMGIEPTLMGVEGFLAGNPRCCGVDRNSHMAGMRYVVVELNYKKPPGWPDRELAPFYRRYVEVFSCGERGEMYGEGTKTLGGPGG